jgi:hypothetical protein
MRTALFMWAALIALPGAAFSDEALDSVVTSVGLTAASGFCPDGAWEGTHWPGEKRPEGLDVWGSYCGSGGLNQGRVETQAFRAPGVVSLYLAGYPGSPDCRLVLKNVRTGLETELRPEPPGGLWRFLSLPVPPDWIGQPVALIAEDRSQRPMGWLALSLPILPRSSILQAIDTSLPQSGFCHDGVYGTTKWPRGHPPGTATWGSFCSGGDAGTGWSASQPIVADSTISLYVAGYPTGPGLGLMAENLQTGRQLLLYVPSAPEENWRLFHFRLPDEWIGQSVRIIARDENSKSFGWLGFSEPVSATASGQAKQSIRIVGLLILLCVPLFLPSIAACMAASYQGVEDLPDLTAIGLVTLGLTGYAAFWFYFSSRIAGTLLTFAGLSGSAAVIGYLMISKNRRARVSAARQLVLPLALVVSASVFVASLGLLYGGDDRPLNIACSRFAPPGPPVLGGDNVLPKVFADAVYAGHIPKPMIGDWLSSDRPPLEAGNALWVYPLIPVIPGDRELAYELLAVVLQCSFLAALWAFLAACGIDRRAMALAIATCFFSGFCLVNSFFVWPKLYPVSFLLIAAAYGLTDRFYEVRDKARIGALAGAALALAMLAHGGSMFAILGLAGLMILYRHYPGRRFLVAMAAVSAILYVPWMLYQKLYDPPGDRLLRWHLAGIAEPRPQASFTSLMLSHYGSLKAGELVHLKIDNFKAIAGDLPEFLGDVRLFGVSLIAGPATRRDRSAASIRKAMFDTWVASMGLAVLGPLALLISFMRKRRGVEFTAAVRMWWLNALILVLWSLILFGPGTTAPRQGTYMTEVLALAGSCLAFWAIRPWLAVTATAAQILWNALLFIWLTPVTPAAGMEVSLPNSVLGMVCAASATALFVVLAIGTASGNQWLSRRSAT